MFEKKLLLDNLDKVRQFTAIASSKDYDIELTSGKYIVNAKSIVGIFSLDLTKPVTMIAHCEKVAEISKQVEPFACVEAE